MPLNIEVKGDSASIAATAAQLRSLATSVFESGTTTRSVLSESESEWIGSAGEAFRDLLTRVQNGIDEHENDLRGTAQALQTYAEELIAVKAAMARAADIAREAGLEVTPTTIADPGQPPAIAATVTALAAYAAKVGAYQTASRMVRSAQQRARWAGQHLKEFLIGIWKKLGFNLADFGAGFGAAYTAAASAFTKHTEKMQHIATKALDKGRVGLLGAMLAKGNSGLSGTRTLHMAAVKRIKWAKFFNKPTWATGPLQHVPILGVGITTASVAYDIFAAEGKEKKDPLTAATSGYGGFLLGVGATALLPATASVITTAGLGFLVSAGSSYLIEQAME